MNEQRQRKPRIQREEIPRVRLNFELQDIDADLDRKRQLWCGEKKIGKTVNANRAGAYFLKFEAGHSHIRHHGETIKDWNHFRAVAREIILQQREGKFPFDKVCIDTLGECYKRCSDWILQKYAIMHEGDLGHGKGYSLIENSFREVIMPLSNAGLGVIFLAHTEEKELKDKHDQPYKKAVPQLSKGCSRVIGGMVDLLLFFTVRYNEGSSKWERVIRTAPTQYHEAGVRYPDGWERRLPVEIPMSWEALKNAWDAGRPDEAEPEPEREPRRAAAPPQDEAPQEPAQPPQQNGGQNGTAAPPAAPQRRTGTKLG